MPAEVKILIEGITNADSVAGTGQERTRPTVTLVREENFVMIVDPGVLESQQILIDALEKEGLRPHDINVVCITHSHLDHYRNIGMFPRAKTLEYYGLWDKESVEDLPEYLSANIQILPTPGHDKTGITIFVKTDRGIVAVCGDVFWKEDYPQNPKDDFYADDPEKLLESRKLVLKIADWIIPGHAGIYKAKKDILKAPEFKKERFLSVCRKCRISIESKKDICICRPWLCYRCCECTLDCNNCNCSHRKGSSHNVDLRR